MLVHCTLLFTQVNRNVLKQHQYPFIVTAFNHTYDSLEGLELDILSVELC